MDGNINLTGNEVGIKKPGAKRNLISNVSFKSYISLKGEEISLHRLEAEISDGIKASLSGKIKNIKEKAKIVNISFNLPEVAVSSLRDTLFELIPDRFKYARMNGNIQMSGDYTKSTGMNLLRTSVRFKDVSLTGENGEYGIGPISGNLPLYYDLNEKGSIQPPFLIADIFRKERFERIGKEPIKKSSLINQDSEIINIGKITYGVEIIKDLSIVLNTGQNAMTVENISGSIFGGKIYGAGWIALTKQPSYGFGFVAKDISLKEVCKSFENIKGYIYGKVDGIMWLNGDGIGLSAITGKAEVWAKKSKDEPMMISREMLERIGGSAVKRYGLSKDRRYNKGVIESYFNRGYIIFKELEVSNTNIFGFRDLSVKVAPVHNRIAIDDLLWTIKNAAERATTTR